MKYVCVSGGADSTAMALMLWEQGEDFEMVFADTGVEFPENYVIISRLQKVTGKKLHVVSGGGFFKLLVSQGYFLPSPKAKWCTRLLKQEPINDYLLTLTDGEIVMCNGIRADEPRRVRSSLPKPKKKYDRIKYTYPLFEAGFTKKDVFELCIKYDLLNPIYEWRSSVSCFCCPLQRKSDWIGLKKYHPELFEVAKVWEELSLTVGRGYTWRQGTKLETL